MATNRELALKLRYKRYKLLGKVEKIDRILEKIKQAPHIRHVVYLSSDSDEEIKDSSSYSDEEIKYSSSYSDEDLIVSSSDSDEIVKNGYCTSDSGDIIVLSSEDSGHFESDNEEIMVLSSEDNVIEVGNPKSFSSEKPSFVRRISNASVSSDFRVSIPKEHVEEFMIVKKLDKVTLKVGSKTWDVAVAYGKKLVRLSTGWKEFSVENNLKANNTCVFELICGARFVYKVHIFRG